MARLILPVRITSENKRVHVVDSVEIECSSADCFFCKQNLETAFIAWEFSIPIPLPPVGKKYKSLLRQNSRGKTVQEICYTCQKIPCYFCKRAQCKEWHKEEARKGQEQGCSGWESGRCKKFICKKALIKTNWHDPLVQ